MCVFVCVYDHVIIEKKKSQAISWKTREVGGVIQLESKDLRNRSTDFQEHEMNSQFKQTKFILPLPFYSFQTFNRLDDTHPHL